jgi:hypothetical protein
MISSSRLVYSIAVVAGLVLAAFPNAQAAVSYSTAGSTYFQDFNSLPTAPENVSLGTTVNGAGWIDDTASPAGNQVSIVGWYLYHPIDISGGEGGVNGHQRMRIGAGTVNTGAFMDFGSSGNTDRALGNVGSTTTGPNNSDIYIGLRLNNNTGQTLDSFTLSYNGEQWRDGGAATPAAQSSIFMWSTTATAINDANSLFTTNTSLGFTSPVFANTGSGAAVDGNAAGRVAIGPVTVTGMVWLPGTDLWLRWDDISHVGNDHGLAIDDLSFSAVATVPEPSTFALIGIGSLLVLFRRRFQS